MVALDECSTLVPACPHRLVGGDQNRLGMRSVGNRLYQRDIRRSPFKQIEGVQNVSVAPDIALLQIAVASDDGSRIVICTLRPDRLLRAGRSDWRHGGAERCP